MMQHPLYRISTAVEDGQELQLSSWAAAGGGGATTNEEEDYYYDCDGNIECVYNEGDGTTTTTTTTTTSQCYHPPSL